MSKTWKAGESVHAQTGACLGHIRASKSRGLLVGQAVLGDLPDEIGRDLGELGVCAAIFIEAAVGEASNVVADSQVIDLSADFGNIAGEVGARDGTNISHEIHVYVMRRRGMSGE